MWNSHKSKWYPDNYPRGKLPPPQLGLEFGLGLVLELGLILPGGNCPRIYEIFEAHYTTALL